MSQLCRWQLILFVILHLFIFNFALCFYLLFVAMAGGANPTRQLGLGRDQSSSLHSNAPSTLIHHPAKPYPSPAYPLGLAGSAQPYTANRAYSAKVLAFQQPPALLSRLPAIGSSQLSPSPISCHPSSEDSASFFNFDSLSTNPLPQPGPMSLNDLQSAGKLRVHQA